MTDRPPAAVAAADIVVADRDVAGLLPDLRSFFRRRVPVEHVDDLIQDTCLALMSRKGERIESLRNYAFVIGRNLLRGRWRRNSREGEAISQLAQMTSFEAQETPETQTIDQQVQDALSEAIDRLPPRTGMVFRLSRYDGLTYPEIALHLQISESAVEKNMMRALSALRHAMMEHRR